MRGAVPIGVGIGLLMSCTGSKPESGRQPGAVDSARPELEGVVLRHDRWDYVLPESDPFHAHEPDAEPCPSVGYKAENGFFELETDYCAIASFSQPIPADLSAGTQLRFVVWNLDLWAPEPYEALRFLRLGDTEIWRVTTMVPGDEDVAELVVNVPVDVAAGTLAWFHLRNHGVNSWRIGDVERAP